jgi:CDP-6-deoxy-D-xylo-4-hexulose-3-dehydrase
MLFAGNLTKHPAMTDDPYLAGKWRVVKDLSTTDRIMRDSFWIGVYPGMTEQKLAYMAKMLHECLE